MKKLSQILNLNKLKVVKKNIHKAHGLPNECYTNDDYLKDKVFFMKFSANFFFKEFVYILNCKTVFQQIIIRES